METLFILSATTSLVCLAIHVVITWPGMVGNFIATWYCVATNRVIYALAENVFYDPIQQRPVTKTDSKIVARYARIQEWIIKPVYACLICMASLWTIAAWIYTGRPFTSELLLCILLTCAMNAVLHCFVYAMLALIEDKPYIEGRPNDQG